MKAKYNHLAAVLAMTGLLGCSDEGGAAALGAGVTGSGGSGGATGAGCTDTILDGSFEVHNELDLAELDCYTEITGDLLIDAYGLNNVTLAGLTTVQGSVRIVRSSATTSLPSLGTIGNDLLISDGEVVGAIDVAATSIGRDVEIQGSGITNLASLNVISGDLTVHPGASAGSVQLAVATLHGNLELEGHDDSLVVDLPSLATVDGSVNVFDDVSNAGTPATFELPLLAGVGGEVLLDASTAISFPTLNDPHGLTATANFDDPFNFPALVRVLGNMRVNGSGAMSFPALARVTGALIPESSNTLGLPQLQRISQLYLDHSPAPDFVAPSLQTIDTRLYADGCNSLTQLNLPNLATVGSYVTLRSSGLLSVTLSHLSIVPGDLNIQRLEALNGSINFASLTEVGGTITVSYNPTMDLAAPSLTSIKGFISTADSSPSSKGVRSVALPALTTISEHFILESPVPALDLSTLQTVGGTFRLSKGGDAQSLLLPNLATVGENLVIQSAISIPALELLSLNQVGGNITLTSLPVTEIRAPLLSSIGGNLTIGTTHAQNLDLQSLVSLGPTLKILNNPSLPSCQAMNVRDQLLVNGWTGTAQIFNSGPCP